MRAMIARAAAIALLIGLCAGLPAAGADASTAVPPLSLPTGSDGLSRDLAAGQITPAQEALLRARALVHPGRVASRYGPVAPPAGRDATLILRDLAVRLDQLSPSERRSAHAILARPASPTGGDLGAWQDGEDPASPDCGPDICVHWASQGPHGDAPAATDTDPANGVPDWVDLTLATAEHVWDTEVNTMGYRAPLPDASSTDDGGNGLLDIYISNLGSVPLYGYCTTDDPAVDSQSHRFASAFCDVDNDYAEGVFDNHSPRQNLEVTLAHEFFHAVQFGYDSYEDAWLMEGTATWMEDQVYTHINDNRQYLSTSQLVSPWVPLDRTNGCCYQYGSWIWFRFLSESLDPSAIQQIWDRADAAPGGANEYSTQAIRRVLEAHGTTFAKKFAQFAVWNRIPDRTYSEGRAGNYPTPASSGSFVVGSRHPNTGWYQVALKHMSSVYVTFKPARQTGRRPHLTVQVDDPRLGQGSAAKLMVFTRSGAVHVKSFRLSSRGNGSLRVKFGHERVRRVVLIESNASTRFRCNRGTQYSCHGTPVDDGRGYVFRARLH